MLARLALLIACFAALAASSASARTTPHAASCAGAVSWAQAKRYAGSVVTVKGPVVDTRYASTSNGRPTFLNLGRPYPDSRRFTVVIWSENRAAFGAPERRYRGRTICARGLVELYRGSAQMIVRSPSQIALAR